MLGTSCPSRNSALPMPVPSVVMITTPLRPFPAPNSISASPAASASLRTVTGAPTAFVNSAAASVPIHDLSTFAAVSATPSLTTAGNVAPDGALPFEVLGDLGDDAGDRVRGRRVRRRDAEPGGGELAGPDVDRCTLDAGTADVDPQPCLHGCIVVATAHPLHVCPSERPRGPGIVSTLRVAVPAALPPRRGSSCSGGRGSRATSSR